MKLRLIIHVIAFGLTAAVTGLAPLPWADSTKLIIIYGLSIPNAMVLGYLTLTTTGASK